MSDSVLRVFCSNVRGLVNNWSSATNFNWDTYDLIGFNEIWGIKDFENLTVEGYELIIYKQRALRRGGGVCNLWEKKFISKDFEYTFYRRNY